MDQLPTVSGQSEAETRSPLSLNRGKLRSKLQLEEEQMESIIRAWTSIALCQ